MVARRYNRRINRVQGTVETFMEDSTVVARNLGLTVADMVASVVSGTAVSIPNQAYSDETLSFQVNFREPGQATVKIVTTFVGSDEQIVSLYLIRTLDDGSGDSFGDYA